MGPWPGAGDASCNLIAAYALETTGTQEYQLHPEPLTARFAAAYGDQAAAEIARHYI
jgi:adenosine kinase